MPHDGIPDIIDDQLIETMRKLTACRRLLGVEKETNASLVELLQIAASRMAEVAAMINVRVNQITAPERLALEAGEREID